METAQQNNRSAALSFILAAVSKLEDDELDLLYFYINERKRNSESKVLPPSESGLLEEINQGFPQEKRERYHLLRDKQLNETILDEELDELVALSDEIEEFDAVRLEKLMELARLRNTSLAELSEELGLKPETHVA
ncbi:MAG: hypothetical protein F6K17_38225 [Okeania sp. SIO3C4]|nr:hypothetical protein [Okeania sp. SIO3C4]